MISTNALKKQQWTSAGWINSEVRKKQETTRDKDGFLRGKLPEVVTTAEGPNGELRLSQKMLIYTTTGLRTDGESNV